MFANACERGRAFTRPVVMVHKCADGTCRTSVASFTIVNDQGWFLSAWHVHAYINGVGKAVRATIDHSAKIAEVEARQGLSKGQRRNALRQLGTLKSDAPLDLAVWWSRDNVKVVDACGIPQADLLLGRLEPFDPSMCSSFPEFWDPAREMRQGTSLCRLGYPFPSVEVSHNGPGAGFKIDRAELAIFPIEGILTRRINAGKHAAGFMNSFVETSSPGLKGQSGGPILDVQGVICGIQSSTRNLSLGFDPEVPSELGPTGKPKSGVRREHQFLNVGWAVHPETIVGLLREKKVAHTLAK